MNCPNPEGCDCTESRVIGQRKNDGRYRQCKRCGWRWTTVEVSVEEAKLMRRVREAVTNAMETR